MASDFARKLSGTNSLGLRLSEPAKVEEDRAEPHVALDLQRPVVKLLSRAQCASQILNSRLAQALQVGLHFRRFEGGADLKIRIRKVRGNRLRLGQVLARVGRTPMLVVDVRQGDECGAAEIAPA